MKAMILAAGEGTRLRPLTDTCPKPMLPIHGKPLLAHTLVWLRRYGVDEVAINLHHLPQAITDHFGDGSDFGVAITYSYEPELLGTAGAVKRLGDYFDGTFFVVYGDVLTDLDLMAMYGCHRARRSVATLALHRVADPSGKGVVAVDDEYNIQRFVEKPAPGEVFSDLVNSGVYVLEPVVLDYIPEGKASDFGRDVFPKMLADGARLGGCLLAEGTRLVDIGTMEAYDRACRDLGITRITDHGEPASGRPGQSTICFCQLEFGIS